MTNIDKVRNGYLYDLFNPSKYYKFAYEQNELSLISTVTIMDRKLVKIEFETMLIVVDWNPNIELFTVDFVRNDTLLRRVSYGITYSMTIVYTPDLPGVPLHIFFVFDITQGQRIMYIFRSLDILEEY